MGLFGGPPDIRKLHERRDEAALLKALAARKAWSEDIVAPVAAALAEVGTTAALPALATVLRERRGWERGRAAAAGAIAQIVLRCARRPLGEAAQRSDPVAFRAAVAVLGQAAAATLPALEQALADSPAREAAAIALGMLADARAVAPLERLARDGSSAGQIAALRGLALIPDERAVAAVRPALGDDDERVRAVAVEVLTGFGWQPDGSEDAARYFILEGEPERCVAIGEAAVRPLVRAIDRPGVVEALVAIGAPAAPELAAALGWRSAAVAERDAIRRIGAPAIPALANALVAATRPSPQLLAALRELGWEAGSETEAIAADLAAADFAACCARGDHGVARVVAALDAARAASDWESRDRAIAALGGSRSWAAAAALLALPGRARDRVGDLCRLIAGPLARIVAEGEATAPAVGSLVDALLGDLTAADLDQRRLAATLLVALYARGALAGVQRRSVLAQRAAIRRPHVDESEWRPSDCGAHTDNVGIGVDFPLADEDTAPVQAGVGPHDAPAVAGDAPQPRKGRLPL